MLLSSFSLIFIIRENHILNSISLNEKSKMRKISSIARKIPPIKDASLPVLNFLSLVLTVNLGLHSLWYTLYNLEYRLNKQMIIEKLEERLNNLK